MEQEKDNNAGRIEEIINELNECREDERSSQNQIVQVVYIAGSVIGVVFGFTISNKEIDSLALLLLNDAVFCTAFSFIVPLGIGNVLRYHYIQDLEDRLAVLIPNGSDRKNLIHWMSFSAPVTTRNPRSLKSIYAWLHFVFYALSIISVITFSVGVISYQYVHLEKTMPWWKIFILIIPFLVILAVLVVFLYVCLSAKTIYKFALKKSIEKRKRRFKEKGLFIEHKTGILTTEKHNKELQINHKRTKSNISKILRIVYYFVYPKHKDFQKVFVVIWGYITGLFLMNGSISGQIVKENLRNIIMVVIVIDFLVYQARYQWNDIRGLPEDIRAGKIGRLPVDIMGKWQAVSVSLIIMLVKIGTAFLIVINLRTNKKVPLLISIGLILLTSIIYELVRSKEYNTAIFIVVALGYPLRLLTGIWFAWPEFWKGYFITGGKSIPVFIIVLLLIASFAFYGELSVVLSWTQEAIIQKRISGDCYKSHYRFLIKSIKKRYNDCLLRSVSGKKIYPLKEKGKISDLWNISSLCALLFLSVILYMTDSSLSILIIDLLIFAVVVAIYLLPEKNILFYVISLLALIAVKVLVAVFCLKWMNLYVCACQAIFIVTYYFLRYHFDPDFDFFKFAFVAMVGKDTFSYLQNYTNET